MNHTERDTAAASSTATWPQQGLGWWAPLARLRCLLAQQICQGLG